MSDLTEKELEQAAKEYPSWLAPDTFGRLVAEVRRLRAENAELRELAKLRDEFDRKDP